MQGLLNSSTNPNSVSAKQAVRSIHKEAVQTDKSAIQKRSQEKQENRSYTGELDSDINAW